MTRVGFVLLLATAIPAVARGNPALDVQPAASAELVYNDGVDLIFEENDVGNSDNNVEMGNSVGLGANVDLSAGVAAHPFSWLSLQIRPELFLQVFLDRRDTALVRCSPPLFVRVGLQPKLALLFASEYVANLVPYRSTFTFHRETATTRLEWRPWSRILLALESIERIKRYPDRVTWNFRSHRVGANVAAIVASHVRLDAAYALQLNSGADNIANIGNDVSGPTADGWQHLIFAGIRIDLGAHLVEARYQARIARGGDAVAAVDEPLINPRGIVEEDSDELSLGGFDKHIVEVTYDVRIGSRVVGDLYGRWSRKSFLDLRATFDPTLLRVDDVWLVGAAVSIRLARGFGVDARALYHVNDSNDADHSFRNLIVGLGAHWEQ